MMIKHLNKIALEYSVKKTSHAWRLEDHIQQRLLRSPTIASALSRIANGDRSIYTANLNAATRFVLMRIQQFRQTIHQNDQYQNLHPSHPAIINNLHHPLNPNNPNNLMLNPDNVINNQAIDTKAAIFDSMLGIEAENKHHDDTLAFDKHIDAARVYLEEKNMSLEKASNMMHVMNDDDKETVLAKINNALTANPDSIEHAAASHVLGKERLELKILKEAEKHDREFHPRPEPN